LKSVVKDSVLYQSLAGGLVLLAVWLRFWQLDCLPPGLWFDESYNGMDAIWMMTTRIWPIFLAGNNGREALYHYWLTGVIFVLGNTAYAIRLSAVLLSVIAPPLMYRWGITLFRGQRNAQWLALVGTAGLVTSFWYLLMNRTGYRANLLPLFVLATSWLFWRGWQNGKLRFYLLAGVMLGLSQYSYFSARLLPLVFGLFTLTQTIFGQNDKRHRLKIIWLGLIVMAVSSAVVALPMLIFIFNNPGAAWGRTLEVSVKLGDTGAGWIATGMHVVDALRVFVDGQDPNWRHHLVGMPMFDVLNMAGFWLGLGVALWQIRQPMYQFLVILLGVMWLPAPLANPAVHSLRLSGMLPAYYTLMAVGLITTINWLFRNKHNIQPLVGPVVLGSVVIISGSLTVYNYFWRWGQSPEVYYAFDGQVNSLAAELDNPAANIDVVIPFYLYTHASFRYLIDNNFIETVFMPEQVATKLRQQTQTTMVIPAYPPDDGKPPAYVWLKKAPGEKGIAYVSAVFRPPLDFKSAGSAQEMVDKSRQVVTAQTYPINPKVFLPLFPARLPVHPVAVNWSDKLRLIGYEFSPALINSDRTSSLRLAWQILGDSWITEKMFLQVLDSNGNSVGQQEIDPVSRKMYRWRKDGLILELLPLDFAKNLSPGLYFVRLGFFNPDTGQRLPAFQPETRQPPGNELVVGPLVVKADGLNPVEPARRVTAALGDGFKLMGYAIKPASVAATEVTLYWQSTAPAQADYTVFLQLLNPANQVMAQTDAQPLPGLYPTSRWQPGDIIPQQLVLPAPIADIAGNRLVTGMYNVATGERLPASDAGKLLPNGAIPLNTTK